MISLISTADCNIDCRACSQNDVRLVNVQHRPQTVPDVLAHVPYLYQFIWHGGEPYLIRAFREFVDTFQTIDNPNLTFGFTSNGTMVTENEARKLRKFPGINASISIDSFNSDTFRKIRSGADFERVMENYLRLQATGDWPRRVLSVGMIVCKTNIGELGSNVSAAIHNDIGLNLSPVLLYPATEQLNVFEDFNSQTEGWEEALRRTAEVIAEAKSARRIAIGRIDPSGMVRELVSILAVQRANHAATKEIEITIEADEDFNTVMREPGIIAQVEDDPIPVAYVRLSRGAGNYVLRLPEGRVKGTQFVQIRLLHDLLEQGGVVGLGSVSIAGTPRVKLEVPPFKPVRRKRNIEMANYGVSSPSGLFLTSPSDVWNAYEQMTRVEQSAGHGVQTVYRSPDSKDWRTSQFGRLIGRWGSRLS
jgi:pyruvate-formate lyase-activating enzyme